MSDEVKIKLLGNHEEVRGCFLNQMCTETTGLAMANFKGKEHTIFYAGKEIFPENVFEQRLRG